MSIYYIDRNTGQIMEEIVAGDVFLQWLYETKTGYFFLLSLVKRKLFSYLYGKMQDTKLSSRKTKRFIDDFKINMDEALIEVPSLYCTFNDFFTRKLKAESRPLALEPDVLISPADGRVSAWENIDSDKLLQVKGSEYNLTELLQNPKLALEYSKGTCIVIRLCPADYHRFHFPDQGLPSESLRINGHYYSVNPRALRKIPKLYCENKRDLTIFYSANFGKILLIEVGATCVGSIVQTYLPQQPVEKGAEKGYFKFGGSTVILFFKRNTVKIDKDLLVNTAEGIETKVVMGEKIGQCS